MNKTILHVRGIYVDRRKTNRAQRILLDDDHLTIQPTETGECQWIIKKSTIVEHKIHDDLFLIFKRLNIDKVLVDYVIEFFNVNQVNCILSFLKDDLMMDDTSDISDIGSITYNGDSDDEKQNNKIYINVSNKRDICN